MQEFWFNVFSGVILSFYKTLGSSSNVKDFDTSGLGSKYIFLMSLTDYIYKCIYIHLKNPGLNCINYE